MERHENYKFSRDDRKDLSLRSPSGLWQSEPLFVIASGRKSLRSNPVIICLIKPLDCHVATAPRNDSADKWIAASLPLLAMKVRIVFNSLQ